MKTRQIGKTKLHVTELGYGGAPLGNLYHAISNEQAFDSLHAAWDGGIRYYDTAPQYGSGLSEHRIGDVLREHPREEFVLSTKVGKILTPSREPVAADEQWFIDALPFKVSYDYSYDGIKQSIHDSLQRLGMSYIDIAHIHDLDHIVLGDDFEHYFKIAMDSGYKALAELKQQGVINAISMGVKQWQVCAKALKHGDFDCFMLQDSYTLLDHDALDFLNDCAKRNISILQAGPFSSGILAKGPVPGAHYHYVEATPEILEKVRKIQAICEEFNVPLPAAAMQFPLHHPAVASVVTGMRTKAHVEKNIEWIELPIPQEMWQKLKAESFLPESAPI